MALNQRFLTRVKDATCAIGFLRVPIEEHRRKPGAPNLKIVGTGFLVRPGRVLTNRHVLVDLETLAQREGLGNDRYCVQFLRAGGPMTVNTGLSHIFRVGWVMNPTLDLGVADFTPNPDPQFSGMHPATITESMDIRIGDPIACIGYPFGTHLLERDGDDGQKTMYRIGPALQQGWVSAFAPFDEASEVQRLLLDIRTWPGMSGSPVFSTATGAVVGIHDAGRETVTAFAIPLTALFVSALLASLDTNLAGTQVLFEAPAIRRSPR